MRLAVICLIGLAGAAAGAAVWLASTPKDTDGAQVGLDFGKPKGVAVKPGHAGGDGPKVRIDRGGGPATSPSVTPAPSPPRTAGLRSIGAVPALLERGAHGDLPRIAADGRVPWRVYSRSFNTTDTRPRIAVVIAGLGLKSDVTDSAINDLPGVVTLAFSPYGRKLRELARAARQAGHEVLLGLPLETPAESGTDPGPRALRTSLSPAANLDRLHWIMGRTNAYVGLLAWPVGSFAKSPTALDVILAEARKRGVLIVDGRPATGPPDLLANHKVVWSRATVWLDRNPSPAALEAAFIKAERIARKTGRALVIGRPYPLTLTRVRGWLEGFEGKGLVAAPVTAVVNTDRKQSAK